MKRHRWGEKTVFPHKSERPCLDCGIVKVTRHEWEGGRDQHWTEFYRGLDRIQCERTPTCEPIEAVA